MPNDMPDMPIPEQLGICPDCGYYPLDELYHLQAENRALQLKLAEIRKNCPNCGGKGEVDSGGVYPWGEGIFIACPFCNPPTDQPKEKS